MAIIPNLPSIPQPSNGANGILKWAVAILLMLVLAFTSGLIGYLLNEITSMKADLTAVEIEAAANKAASTTRFEAISVDLKAMKEELRVIEDLERQQAILNKRHNMTMQEDPDENWSPSWHRGLELDLVEACKCQQGN